MPPLKHIERQRYGRLTVLRLSRRRGRVAWECQCDCGQSIVVARSELQTGDTQSCGCLRRENTQQQFRRHGMSQSGTYRSWKLMKRRCLNPNTVQWRYYGGRGIWVCQRWRRFENFLADMGERPSGMTIDRINNDDGYYPENCRWTTQNDQLRNRRKAWVLKHS